MTLFLIRNYRDMKFIWSLTRYTSKALQYFCLLIILFGHAYAATYYVATNGDDHDDGSASNPWATFTKAMTILGAGDTLYINDGTYYQTLNVTTSGTNGNPITIAALNDGAAIVDGQSSSLACIISGESDITIEGIVCQNSSSSGLSVSRSDRVTLRRVSTYNAGVGNYHIYSIYQSDYVTLEDCAASGSGRVAYNVQSSNYVTIRRCWARWVSHSGGGGPEELIQIYGSNNSVIENCVGTQATSTTVEGFGVWANTYNSSADRNSFYGNVVYGLRSWAFFVSAAEDLIQDNHFANNVAINNSYGFFQRADDNLIVENQTIVETTNTSFGVQQTKGYNPDPDFVLNGTLKNSVLSNSNVGLSVTDSADFGSFTNTYNTLHSMNDTYSGIASKGTGEITTAPTYDTSTYGNGAYLIQLSNLAGLGEGGGGQYGSRSIISL